MRFGETGRSVAVLSVALLCAPAAAPAQTEVGGAAVWYWPAYGPYLPYPYGIYAPWGPCAPGLCIDDAQVRGALRRELQRQELRRELELRDAAAAAAASAGIRDASRPPPPPTPESHLQPQYRGSGEVRPEYRDAGREK